MSLLSSDFIKLIAEHGGMSALRDDVAVALAHDIEYRLRDIIQESLKFMRHAKRTQLTTDDVNHALEVRNVERMYGVSTTAPLRFKHVASNTFGSMFYIEDEELDLDDVINAPLPKVPLDVCFTTHWLAIEGVQPAIPQNPASIENRIEELSRRLKNEGRYDFLERKTEVKPMVRHILSKELQLYYEKIVEALLSENDAELCQTAVESIREDHGIQQLLPYLIQFITEQVTKNLKNLPVQRCMLTVLDAILTNPNFFIEPYLHQLMPPILTCLVAKRLSERPTEDHWSARNMAARLITRICSKYGNVYQTLQPRVTRTLLRAFLDPLKPLSTHYGAIVGLTHLGPAAVKSLIMPNLMAYLNLIRPELASQEESLKKSEAQKCFEALLDATVIYAAHEYKLCTVAASAEERPEIGSDVGMTDIEVPESTLISSVENYSELCEAFGRSLADRVNQLLKREEKQ